MSLLSLLIPRSINQSVRAMKTRNNYPVKNIRRGNNCVLLGEITIKKKQNIRGWEGRHRQFRNTHNWWKVLVVGFG
jgi:hypothetical protein